MDTKVAMADPYADLRNRMARVCRVNGTSGKKFLLGELAQAAKLQDAGSITLKDAGKRMEAAALALLREL